MSAFVVSDYHIDSILTSFYNYNKESKDFMNLDMIGSGLLEENYKSVNYRYNNVSEVPPLTVLTYKFKKRKVPLTPVELMKAIQCLDYQSCEHDGWKDSTAKKFLDELLHQAISRLPGYEEAAWGLMP